MSKGKVLPWVGALAGAFIGFGILAWLRRHRQPCGLCRQAERTGVAPVVAATIGAVFGFAITQQLLKLLAKGEGDHEN